MSRVVRLRCLAGRWSAQDGSASVLAAVWIAYDDTIESPAILRTEGPWWRLRRSTTLGAPTLLAFRPPDDTTPASPDVIAACRAKLRKGQPHD